MLTHFKFCFVALNGYILAALYSKPALKAAFIRKCPAQSGIRDQDLFV